MKVKLNPFFFIMTVGVPIAVGFIVLPYALFIASTPYYFSFPFGNFWQEYLAVLIIFDIPLIGVMSYMAVPYLVIIKNNKIIICRLRKRLTIDIHKIERMEFLWGTSPPPEHAIGLGARAYIKGGDVAIIVGISPAIAKEIKLLLDKHNIEWVDTKDRLFSSPEQEKRFKKRGY